jgi:UDP-N-acetyl-D-glucosamine dehydrogenase
MLKVCSGHTQYCLEVGITLYRQVIDKVVPVNSLRAAELTKLLENIHCVVNIGLANEMKIVADKMDIDIDEVIRAAATKPFGLVPYYSCPGLGGHCIPIDPFYLAWKAREYGVHTRFIELVGEVNSSMSDYVASKVAFALNYAKKSINVSRVLMLGIAYRKNVDDISESPSVVLMEKLRDLGADVSYGDPHIPKFPEMREHNFDLSSVPLTLQNLSGYDCVILATNYDMFDFQMIKESATVIIDTRGVYTESHPNVMEK